MPITYIKKCQDKLLSYYTAGNDSHAKKVNINFSISHSGCKESQFYSLPFGQAVVSMY